MPITQSEMNALREMFLEVAGGLLESERAILREMFAPVEARLASIEARLGKLEQRMTQVEVQVMQLVRIDEVERRLEALESTSHRTA